MKCPCMLARERSSRQTPNVLSLTTTLNLSPIPNLQVRPELRWDHCSKEAYTSKSTAKSDQILLGVGVAYLF